MPFIGKNPTSGFSTIVKDDLTPDGSTTAFTLSKNVASANDIAVFVGNVRQEPTDAYSVSGTTLTMTAAPASGVNFYVLHIAGTVESSVVPAAGTTVPGAFGVSGDLTVDTDVLKVDSTNNRVGINQSAPDSALEVRGGSNNQFKVSSTGAEANMRLEGGSYGQFNNTTGALYITNDTSSDIYLRTASTTRMTIDSTGRMSLPYQPYFYAKNTGAGSENGDGITTSIIIFPTETKDVGNNLSNTGSRFTAPVDGLYFFTGVPGYKQTSADFAVRLQINGTHITDVVRLIGSGVLSHSGASFGLNIYLNANDYVELTSVSGAYHRNNSSVANWWSGGLLWAT